MHSSWSLKVEKTTVYTVEVAFCRLPIFNQTVLTFH